MLIANAPNTLLNLIKRNPPEITTIAGALEFNNSEININRYNEYLEKQAPIAIEGNNGDKTTFKVSQMGKNFGLSPEQAFECLLNNWNDKCKPPWMLEELSIKVQNAYKYSDSIPIGALNPENQFEPVNDLPDEFKDVLKPISKIKNAKDYQWLVPNLFARGFISIMFGEPGSGKTWLILALCLSLSNGSTLWNGISVKKSKVLLLEGDSPDALLKMRLEKFDEKLNDKYFYYVNRYTAENNGINLSLSDIKGRKNFEKIIKANRPDFIVIDTLISFINDEKDAEGVKTVIDDLRKRAEKYNCHILICHHSRKRMTGEKRNKLDQSDVIGSSIIIRLASVVIGVERNDQ